MEVDFLGQPFADSKQIGEVVCAALQNEEHDRAWFVTAWGKQSGLSRLALPLLQFRKAGGAADVILGVDEGGATIEGLKMGISLFDEVIIFHDPGARTFHPKVYVVQNDDRATVVVGSGNLTRGGLFTNFEAAVVAELDLREEEDSLFLERVRAYRDRIAGSGFAKLLTDGLIEELKEDPRVLLLSEGQARRWRATKKAAPKGDSVFGKESFHGLLGAPPPGIDSIAEEDLGDDSALPHAGIPDGDVADEPASEASPATTDMGTAIRSFFKAMSANDVSTKDSPGQIIIPIGLLPFFGALTVQKDESESGGPRQEDRDFSLTFRDGAFEKKVASGRVILYVPADHHKRRNPEVRFTFKDRDLNPGRLERDDVLVFTVENNEVVVERRPAGWRPPGVPPSTRYGVL